MYNFKSDLSRNDPQYVVEVKNRNPYRTDPWITWNIPFWKFSEPEKWKGQHHLLSTTDSPTISACTTATNLSSLDLPHQSLGSVTFNNRRMVTLEENLRVVQPEIEPLHKKEKLIEEDDDSTKGSINNSSSSCSINVYNETTTKKPRIIRQVVTALSVSLVSLIVGFVSAYTSPAAETLMKELEISEEQYSWVSGLMPLGALVGGVVGGQMIELVGRKTTIALTNLLFILSWTMVAAASNVWYLYAARSISGFCVGIASLALPVYLGETVQPEVRGTLGLLPTAFGNTGILMCFAIGSWLKWNQLAWLGLALPTPFLLLMFIIPETPRWYISKGKQDKARSALQWLRGKDADVQAEYEELEKSQKENDESSNSSSIGDLFSRIYLKPLLISLGLMFFQQMSGINAVIFYTTSIFEMAGSTINKNLCTIIVGIVNFISTFIATVLIDRLGRKVLLYVSSISMILTLTCLGTYFYLSKIGVNVAPYGWLPLASFVIYVLGFSLGFGPIPWLMLGEILPAKIRGSAAALATSFNWSCTFIVTKTFIDIIKLIGPHGTFWLFAGICLISVVFIIMWVPETQGQSLQDIERKLAGMKVRRMSSKANMKPLPSTF